MKIIYICFLVTLYWSYGRAFSRLRSEQIPLSPILGWMAGLGYFVLAPLTLLILNGGYTIPAFYGANDRYNSVDFSNGAFFIPMVVLWMSLLLAFQTVVILAPRIERRQSQISAIFDQTKLKKILFVTFGLALADYVLQIWVYGGWESYFVAHWYIRQEEMYQRAGELWVLYVRFSGANQIIFTAAASLYMAFQLQKAKVEWRFSLFLGLALLVQMVMSGNRIYIALFGLAFLTSCWFYKKKKMIATILVISPLLLVLFSAWAYFRGDLSTISERVPAFLEADLGNRLTTTLMDTTEAASIMISLHMVNDFGSKFDYLYGATYAKAFTFIIPRRFYPNKSENFPATLAKLYEPWEVTSLGATQFGELYANFGPLTILLLPLSTVLILFLSARLGAGSGQYLLLSPLLFALLAWSTLASMEDSFVTLLFSVVLFKLLRLTWELPRSLEHIETQIAS